MTREEARDKAFRHEMMHTIQAPAKHLVDEIWINRISVIKFIDKIYDSFESRTCDSCNRWRYEGNGANEKRICQYLDMNIDYELDADFCCNKYEAKDK